MRALPGLARAGFAQRWFSLPLGHFLESLPRHSPLPAPAAEQQGEEEVVEKEEEEVEEDGIFPGPPQECGYSLTLLLNPPAKWVNVEAGAAEDIHSQQSKCSSSGDGGALGCVGTGTPPLRGVSAFMLKKLHSSFSILMCLIFFFYPVLMLISSHSDTGGCFSS